MNSLEVTDEQSKAVQKTPNRVSLEQIKNSIVTVEYHNPEVAPQMTVAFVLLKNGFVAVGQAAPADPNNFNKDLGRQFAYEDAIRKIWPCAGYSLCDQLYNNWH